MTRPGRTPTSVLGDGPTALRVYESVRTAHLERLRTMTAARTVYHRTRYDYDASLAEGPLRPRRVGRRQALREVVRRQYRAIELNEPLMTQRWPDLLAQVAAIRLRPALGRPTARVSAYCIGLTDPAAELAERYRLPAPLTRMVTTVVLRILVRGMDRLVFGTHGCYDLTARYVGGRLLEPRSRVIPALPTACTCPPTDRRDHAQVLFVGAFNDRKGIRQLMAAWDALPQRRRELTLHLVGKGPLEGEVRSWAEARDEVRVDVDPPRAEVHQAYRRAHVVVLLSQRVGSWREQVGLPIIEALAHGCEVVTTDETGLASWLVEQRHTVVPAGATSMEVAAALVETAARERSTNEILADLPSVDSRLEADRWMLQDGDDKSMAVTLGRSPRTHAVTMVFPSGKGVASWRQRGAASPVPGSWPYGLDGIADSRTSLADLEISRPSRLARLSTRVGLPGTPRRRKVRGAAVSWDEQTALRMVAALDADAMFSGVIWITDRLGREDLGSEVGHVRRALVRLDGLWCLSAPQVDAVRRWLGPDCPPTHFVRFGVDPHFYAPVPYPDRPLVASVGGDRDRDATTLFAALEEVRRRRPEVDCVVQTASRLRPPDGVRLVPHLPHARVRDLLGRATAVAIATRPNLHISGMTVALESMSVGRPVVISSTPGMDDYVADGGTGIHVPPSDPTAMAASLLALLDDPGAAEAMGVRGRRAVEERFTTQLMCAQLRAIVSGADA